MEEKPAELPVSPQETQIQPPSFMDKLKVHKLKILAGVLGILVFVGAVFGAYKLGQRQVQPPGLVATPTPLPSEAPAKEGDQTADWKIYTTNKILSFKYPQTWVVSEITHGFYYCLPDASILPQSAVITLDTRLERTYNQSVLGYKENIENPKMENTLIAEKPATIISGKLGPGFAEGTFVIYVIVSYQDKAIVIGYSGEEKGSYRQIFNPMLSTFKFLEEKESVGEKVFCKDPRPEVCTMECIQNPPYICGSDGKSYCSECQACADPDIEWYVIQDELCKAE